MRNDVTQCQGEATRHTAGRCRRPAGVGRPAGSALSEGSRGFKIICNRRRAVLWPGSCRPRSSPGSWWSALPRSGCGPKASSHGWGTRGFFGSIRSLHSQASSQLALTERVVRGDDSQRRALAAAIAGGQDQDPPSRRVDIIELESFGCADGFDELSDGAFRQVTRQVGLADHAYRLLALDDRYPMNLVLLHGAQDVCHVRL